MGGSSRVVQAKLLKIAAGAAGGDTADLPVAPSGLLQSDFLCAC